MLLSHASLDLAARSSKLVTTMASAVIPSGGVPTLYPNPRRASFFLRGEISTALSSPLNETRDLLFQYNFSTITWHIDVYK